MLGWRVGSAGVRVVIEGTPRALEAVGCESVWVKRLSSLDYLRGPECDEWANVVEEGGHDISPVGHE